MFSLKLQDQTDRSVEIRAGGVRFEQDVNEFKGVSDRVEVAPVGLVRIGLEEAVPSFKDRNGTRQTSFGPEGCQDAVHGCLSGVNPLAHVATVDPFVEAAGLCAGETDAVDHVIVSQVHELTCSRCSGEGSDRSRGMKSAVAVGWENRLADGDGHFEACGNSGDQVPAGPIFSLRNAERCINRGRARMDVGPVGVVEFETVGKGTVCQSSIQPGGLFPVADDRAFFSASQFPDLIHDDFRPGKITGIDADPEAVDEIHFHPVNDSR